jgi:hypothetical protein
MLRMGFVGKRSACVPGKGQASIGRADHHFWHALARGGHGARVGLKAGSTLAVGPVTIRSNKAENSGGNSGNNENIRGRR